MILIYPPVAKPSEAPAGIARLSGALNRHRINHSVLDANLEGLLHLLQQPLRAHERSSDRWTLRSFRNCSENILSLKRQNTYDNFDGYKRTVLEVNRVLRSSSASPDIAIGLANYEDRALSPLKSGDLIRAAEDPERSPFYPYFKKRLAALIEEKRPAVVGLSLTYLGQALCAFAMAGFIRKSFPAVKIVLGGGLVTSWIKRQRWKNPFTGLVDLLVAGPGEYPLLSLYGIDEGKKDFLPDYSSFPMDNYFAPGSILPYSASRGCFWQRCSFCPERTEDNPYVPVPPEKVVADLSELTKKTNAVLIHFLDNAMSISLMRALSKIRAGIPWYGFTRITRELTDIDFCMALKRSGCAMLKLGLESADQGVLDGMEKGIDVETASLALRTLKKAGIATYVYLLFGTPWETLASARRTLEFVVRHGDTIGFLNLAIFNMPVCGNGGEIVTRDFYEADLSLYTDFLHPEEWDRKKVRSFLENEFKRQRVISSILKRDPPLFTSNHAPFIYDGHI
jgi:radical SAM superfamily enzyme YgiQ (UPF0313 family)